MKLNNKMNRFVLSTGRCFYAYNHLLSVDESGCLYYGYDGRVEGVEDLEWDDPNKEFTAEERVEIADYIIALWKKWRDG